MRSNSFAAVWPATCRRPQPLGFDPGSVVPFARLSLLVAVRFGVHGMGWGLRFCVWFSFLARVFLVSRRGEALRFIRLI